MYGRTISKIYVDGANHSFIRALKLQLSLDITLLSSGIITVKPQNPPHAHPKAIGQYRLAVWWQWGEEPIQPVKKADGIDLHGTWPALDREQISVSIDPTPSAPHPGDTPLNLYMKIVDPMGRMSDVVITTPTTTPL